MKKGLAYSLIIVFAVLAIVFAAIHFTNNADKTKQINSLTADVADKAGQIETLNADVADKAGQIETLNADVADKAGQIETLNADVANKAGQIETLNADVADKASQIETLNADVADKAGQIETLSADMAKKTSQIETLTTDVSNRDMQINALKDDVASKTKQIETLNSELEEAKANNELLASDLAEKTSKIEALNLEIEKKESQIELLKEMASSSSTVSTVEGDYPLLMAPTEEFVIDRLLRVPDIAYIAAATEDHDPNGHLGKQGGYTAQIYFSSPLVNPDYGNNPDLDVIEAGTTSGGSIEVYATVVDAEKRDKYLGRNDGTIYSSGYHVVIGTLIIRVSKDLTASDQKKLEQEIVEALTAEEPGPIIERNRSYDKDDKQAMESSTSLMDTNETDNWKISKEYQYSNSLGYYYGIAFSHTKAIDQKTTVNFVFYDKNNNIIGAYDNYVGCTGHGYVYFAQGINDAPFDHVVVSFNSTDLKKSTHCMDGLKIQTSKVNNKIIISAENTGDKPVSSCSYDIVFFDNNGNVINTRTGYLNIPDSEMQKGQVINTQCDMYYESFADYEFFYNAVNFGN